MADSEQAYHASPLEALQSRAQQQQPRRIRPPDLDFAVNDENRVPLKADKLSKRESRIGLRSIFGRSKTNKEIESPPPPRELTRPGGIRASLAEISNWPYSLHAKSELTLQTPARPISAIAEAPQAAVPSTKHKKSTSGNKANRSPLSAAPVKSSRGSLATWDPPPLFQAYPQAIKHSQLPAATISADTILRLSDRKGGVRDDLTQDSLSPELGEDMTSDKSTEKPKRKHRRNLSGPSNGKSDWVNKIYVLVTSGYLLQYSAEGSFDRLPEKILHLGKDSAAFVSDAIPGRHWVLQVSSAMDADGNTAGDTRSLFSRLAFRGVERRQASNFLMIFETAEDMESWITILRREIEALGGKKTLSETGKPKPEDNVLQLRAQPSQRTLVVRDPERFSRVIAPEFPWQSQDVDEAEGSVTVVDHDSGHEQSVDDMSTTNSIISHDGRQLESLRDSQHRLSYLSSGQRTIITSAGSSPACSPTRDSFASQLDEPPFQEMRQEVRPRPNAAAIMDRRQSMMTMNPFMEPQRGICRPHSTYSSSTAPDAAAQTTLNFSVPHAVSRRYSLAKSPGIESVPFAPAIEPPPRPPRRSPPTALGISRPLSIVADQPSPILDEPESRPTSSRQVLPETQPVSRPSSRPVSRGSPNTSSSSRASDLSTRRSSVAPTPPPPSALTVTVRTSNSPRKYSSMQCLRPSEELKDFVAPPQIPIPPPPPEPADYPQRCRSSMDQYGRTRSRSPAARANKHIKRASMHSVGAEKGSRFSLANYSDLTVPATPFAAASAAKPTVPPQHLSVELASKALLNRRSMPQLADGPPPAPPPTCALPPIPKPNRNKI